jgi:hypothetical protein
MPKNQTITFSDKTHTQAELPTLVFSYNTLNISKLDININGNTFENVMFDTGFDCFLELLEKDREKLNIQTSLKNAEYNDIFNNQRLVYFDEPDSVKINDAIFSNQRILYGQGSRSLGIKFVKCWSSFSIDPFKKEIEFYL